MGDLQSALSSLASSLSVVLLLSAVFLLLLVLLPVGLGFALGRRRGALVGAVVGVVLAAAACGATLLFLRRQNQTLPLPQVVDAGKPRAATPQGPTRALALYAEANFEGASGAFLEYRRAEPTAAASLAEVDSHVLAAHPVEAATALRRYLEQAKLEGSRRVAGDCVATFLEARAGQAQAKEHLLAQATQPGQTSTCGALAVELLPKGKERTALLKTLRSRPDFSLPGQDPDEDMLACLNSESGLKAWPHVYRPYNMFALVPEGMLFARPVALESTLVARFSGSISADRKLEGLSSIAVARSYLGDHLGAAKALNAALVMAAGAPPAKDVADLGVAFHYEPSKSAGTSLWAEYQEFVAKERRRQVLFLAAILSARARLPQVAREYVALVPDESWGVPMLEPYLKRLETQGREGRPAAGTTEGYQAANQALWPLAWENDIDGLLAALTREKRAGMGILSWVVGDSNRTTIKNWYEKARPTLDASAGFHALLSDVASRRELAQALGDTAENSRLAPIAERLWQAWTARPSAVVLQALARVAGR